MDYLNDLPLSPSERDRLRTLAAPTPASLLGMIRAAPEAFAHFYGQQTTARLVELLALRVDTADLERAAPAYPIQASAVTLRTAPPLLPVQYALEDRDRLFEQLQKLRADPHPSLQVGGQIAACEAELNAMLE